MLVSIVVPVYKVEKYLRQCLDSILAQTFRDMEIIVVDDGSPDGCPGIIDEYAAKDSRVVAVHQQNGGYGKAVNAGIARAKGKYVGIVESDDYIEPDMYASLVETAERTGADLTRCTFSIFDGKRDFLWDEVRELNARDGDIINPHEELDYFLYHSAPWCYLYRRELFETIRLSESKGASYQDVTLVGEALLLSKSVAVVGRPLLHYRMENGQGSSCSGSGRNLMAIVDRCEELKAYMAQRDLVAPKYRTMFLRKAIRAVNWFYERIDEAFAAEFFGRLQVLFAEVKDVSDEIDWDEIPVLERVWLWTVVAGRLELSRPVFLQHPEPEKGAAGAFAAILSAAGREDGQWTNAMFGSLAPSSPDRPVAVILAANAKYLSYLSVTVASVLTHASPDRVYDFIVFVDFDLCDAERVKFHELLRGHSNATLRFFDLRGHFTFPYLKRLFVNRHLSLATYYRFAAPYVLNGYDRCLWMDSDAVACEDIAGLFDLDLAGCAVGGCRDEAVVAQKVALFRDSIAYLKSCGFRREKDYICAGVLLFDLAKMRRERIVERLLSTCAAHEFRMHDQDGLNLVCQDDIRQLDGKWNFIAHENPGVYGPIRRKALAADMMRGGGIWHFAGNQKPWYQPWKQCSFVWWRYARLSPYYEELLQDLTLTTAGLASRGKMMMLQQRESLMRTAQFGDERVPERKIKYMLPYGFMCSYVYRHYGMVVDKPLFHYPGFWRRIGRIFKFMLPYGLVINIWKPDL